LDIFSNKFNFSIGKKTHVLCYLILSPNGELSTGMKHLNWVWYVNTSLKDDMFKKVIVDINGIIRALSVPAGMVNENIVKEQKTIAHDTLSDIVSASCFCNKRVYTKRFMIYLFLKWHLIEYV
jgi:hypothetical protein